MLYQHTQFGLLIVVILGAAAATCLIGAVLLRVALVRWGLAVVAIGLLGLAWVFSSLTVEVGQDRVAWYFGPGFWKYELPRSQVRSVAAVRNSWAHGLGIRIASGFRLYNVSGLDAVELRLDSGEIVRIGTDDPAGLTAALQTPRNP